MMAGWTPLARVMAGWLSLLVALAVGVWVLGAERRALQAMEPGRRAALFQANLESYQRLCREDPGVVLASPCRERAGFLLLFPECTEPCRVQVSHSLRRAER